MYSDFKKLCENAHQDVGEDYGSDPGLITFALLTTASDLSNAEYPRRLEAELDQALDTEDCNTLAGICERQADYRLVSPGTSRTDVLSIRAAVRHFRNLSKHRELGPRDFNKHRNELKQIIKAAIDDDC